MNKWTIGKRIAVTTGFLCLIIGILVSLVVWEISKIRRTNEVITDHNIVCMLAAARMNIILGDNVRKMYQMLQVNSTEERRAIIEESEEASKLNSKYSKEYEEAVLSDENKRYYESFTGKQKVYREHRKRFLSLLETNKDEAEKLLKGELGTSYKEYSAAGNELLDYNERSVDQQTKELEGEIAMVYTLFIAMGVISILIGIGASWAGIRSVNGSLQKISDVLGSNADQVASAAGQVSSSSQSLAENASEQAASLEETSSSLEEMTSTVNHNDERSQNAKNLAGETLGAARSGAADMGQLNEAMDGIKRSSDDISKIIKTIDEIAFQTNILALNAAVEAARAGDAGMGFAVVADEVRNLAQRSAIAAKETSVKIQDAMDKSQQGINYSSKVGQSLSQIVEKAQRMNELVAEIAVASKEQRQGINQISIAVNQMDKITQTNAAGAEETASAAEEMSAQAVEMKGSVADLVELISGAGSRDLSTGGKKAVSLQGRSAVTKRTGGKQPLSLGLSKGSSRLSNGRNGEIPFDDDFKDIKAS